MIKLFVGLISNKCGCSQRRRKKRKILYAGKNLTRFVDDINAFLQDEAHRYALEYMFEIFCSKTKVDQIREETSGVTQQSSLSWSELLCLFKQFVTMPIYSRTKTTVETEPMFEYVKNVLLDEEEQALLLCTLYRIQTGNLSPASHLSIDSWRFSNRASNASAVSLPKERGNNSNGSVIVMECLKKQHLINEENSALDDRSQSFRETNDESAYDRCREKIMELRRLKELVGESIHNR